MVDRSFYPEILNYTLRGTFYPFISNSDDTQN